ncbi:unnamed protein product, partial [Urochloa humidicola]
RVAQASRKLLSPIESCTASSFLSTLDRRLRRRPLISRLDPGRLRRILSLSLAPTTTMSSRRSRATVSEEEINELISRLQTLLPSARRRGGNQASTTKLLKETCSYIKSLHREVDDLSDRLSELMATMDHNSPGAEIIRSLLR